MSSLIKKSMIVAVVFGIGSSGLNAQCQMSKKTVTGTGTQMSMAEQNKSRDTVAIPTSQNTAASAIPVEKATLAPQTTCPVMGGKIDKNVHVDYKGKRVYFCCTMCPQTFLKDPETYIKKLQGMGQGVETIATNNNNGKTNTKDTDSVKKGNSAPMKGMDHSKM
jgi:YHS domain-containing protein